MNTSHFFPSEERFKEYKATSDNRVRYEFTKASYNSFLMATEHCMNKCTVNFSNKDFDAKESACVTACSDRYMDSVLLINNELFNFTEAMAI